MLLKYHFLEVHDIILVLKSFIGDFFFYFWHSLRGCQFFINFRTKGFQSHHKEDCVFNAHAHVAVELSVLAMKCTLNGTFLAQILINCPWFLLQMGHLTPYCKILSNPVLFAVL